MKIDLSGKTAVVTGSTAGIGFAIAEGLASSGAEVVLNGRTEAAVSDAVSKLARIAGDALVRGVAADLGTAEGCETLFAAEPACDILINNVGIFGLQDFFETPDTEWQRFFDESALNIPADMIHYGVTKTANLSVSRGLAKRVAGTGVTINAILPGPTLSKGMQDMLHDVDADAGKSMEEKAVAFVMQHRPSLIIQRAATVEEVANLVVYTASPQASATTGAAL